MSTPRGFKRGELASLSVGDVVQFDVLYQSRTGMIAREALRGRIIRMQAEEVPQGWRPSYVDLEVQDEFGGVQQHRVRSKDAVYVDLAPVEGPAEVDIADAGALDWWTLPESKPGSSD